MMHRSSPRRLPIKEAIFLVLLVGAAFGISWASGRTLVLAEFFAPFVGAVQSVTNTAEDGVSRLQSLREMEAENRALKARLAVIETTLAKRDEQAAENERLHKLLAMPLPPQAEPRSVARVIGRNPDNWHQRVLLDKGQTAGMTERAVVFNQQGLIGHVVALSPHTSLAVLLTDPASSVPVLNTRTRSSGVVVGQGDSWPVLRYMEQPEKWKVGDRLITSGLGSIYPKGLPVGRIVRLKNPENTFFPELRVETTVSLDRLEEVLAMPAGVPAMPEPTPKPTPKPSPSASPAAKNGTRG